MPTFTARLRSLRLRAAAAATVTAVALLLAGCSGSGGDSTHACPTVRSEAGDFVPRGAARPCIVYGPDQQPAGGTVDQPAVPARPGSSNKTPAKPKAPTLPKAPAVKAPAPAVKAPSLVKTR
ncbi:hypothetical protein QR97_01845 [Streptomyces sp. PBH53]|uniref:hypothetical protein n=1 Tax=Streptomyces sp. PBH53 TaxID=1577075 RepID=UPI000655FF42|nr:hypothetical protein [Streptomyces sp. PBH53]AKN68713.1 hypothetical protein QR97_01845 [Streptomyces sp. PBH53]